MNLHVWNMGWVSNYSLCSGSICNYVFIDGLCDFPLVYFLDVATIFISPFPIHLRSLQLYCQAKMMSSRTAPIPLILLKMIEINKTNACPYVNRLQGCYFTFIIQAVCISWDFIVAR